MKIGFLPLVLFLVILPVNGPAATDRDCKGATTTQEIEECLRSELDVTNVELQELHARIVEAIERQARDALEQADSTWGGYRDANCRSNSILYSGGTMETLVIVECKLRMTKARIEELRLIYGEWLASAGK